MNDFKDIKIAVAGTGYVGLSIATLLSQHHHVTAVDVIPEKVEKLNNKISPIQDDYIEKYLAEKPLNLVATLDGKSAYKDADFVVIVAPTNYDSYCLGIKSNDFFLKKNNEKAFILWFNVPKVTAYLYKGLCPIEYL